MDERRVSQFKLTADDIAHVGKIEASIQHWSIQHTRLAIETRAAENQVTGLYEARRQFIMKKAKDSGVDDRLIDQINVAPDGSVTVVLKPGEIDEDPAPVPAPAPNGAAS